VTREKEIARFFLENTVFLEKHTDFVKTQIFSLSTLFDYVLSYLKKVYSRREFILPSSTVLRFVVAFVLWYSIRPCILNFKPNIRVGFRVGTSFSRFPKFNFNVIFLYFRKVWNRTNSKFSVISECSETSVSELFRTFSKLSDSQTGFFWPKNRKLFPNLFLNYFRKIFASLKRPDISEKFPIFKNWTIPKLVKTKSSEISI